MSTSKRNPKPGSMSSRLYSDVAKKILSDTLRIKKGESITIETWSNSIPLALQIVTEAKKMGAVTLLILEDEDVYVEGLKNMPKEITGTMGKHEYNMLAGTDAYVFIPGPPLGSYYSRLTSEKRSAGTRYNSSWYEAAEKARLRGARMSVGYVGRDLASLLGKKSEQIKTHQLRAIVDSDFRSISTKAGQLGARLKDGANCEVNSSDGSTLTFAVKGETEVEDAMVDEDDVANGYNMAYVPPGFVAKNVDSESVSGKVKISSTVTRFGQIKDASLEFESGRLVSWKSKSSMDKLNKIAQLADEDSKKLSTLTIGLNPTMKFGYGQDRFVEGALGLVLAFRFPCIVQKGSLSIDGTKIVDKGKLVAT